MKSIQLAFAASLVWLLGLASLAADKPEKPSFEQYLRERLCGIKV